MKHPADIHVVAVQQVPIFAAGRTDSVQKEYAAERLRNALATTILDKHMERRVTADFVEYKLDLYVADSETFWRLVNETATKIAMGRPI